ncbi:MAG: VOC family protein [Pseudomonadota bacterium]
MFAYIMLGTNDRDRANTFFDGVLGELGMKRFMDFAHISFYGTDLNAPFLGVCSPLDKNDATVGNGSMIALAAGSAENVDRVYAKAIELGASCEGKPGVRPAGFYCAYFRDMDGNKFNACCPAKGEG